MARVYPCPEGAFLCVEIDAASAEQRQLADWLESYAHIMELDVWTSSIATQAAVNPTTGKWDVLVKRDDGRERLFHVDHVVFALGLGAGKPNIPDIPGRVRVPAYRRLAGAH